MRPDIDPLELDLLERTQTERAVYDRARWEADHASNRMHLDRQRWEAEHEEDHPDDASRSALHGIVLIVWLPLQLAAITVFAVKGLDVLLPLIGAQP